MVIEALKNRIVFLDSAPLIYFVEGNSDHQEKLEKLFRHNDDGSIAVNAAGIRAKYNSRTPDALQVATAIEYKADYFFTNDLRLKAISEIEVITLADLY